MAKTSVDQWDTTAGNNTDVGGINIDEGMATGDVNNALREMMAQLKTFSASAIPAGVTASYVGSTAPSGWLLLNGDTLGSAASTATQKSDDYQTLYALIWTSMADAEAPVEGGRGASATADFTANKKLTLPDARGRAIFGKEGTATLLTAAISLDGATLGIAGGSQLAQDHRHAGNQTNLSNDDGGELGELFNKGGSAIGLASAAGDANAAKMGGDSGNVAPAIILNWIIKI